MGKQTTAGILTPTVPIPSLGVPRQPKLLTSISRSLPEDQRLIQSTERGSKKLIAKKRAKKNENNREENQERGPPKHNNQLHTTHNKRPAFGERGGAWHGARDSKPSCSFSSSSSPTTSGAPFFEAPYSTTTTTEVDDEAVGEGGLHRRRRGHKNPSKTASSPR
ncbi:hypothetical protein GCK72_016470 [Caenorhabditis remanei]|uniref:Uncharacterized protein n=1 Tax=Caenorhabditis remanei TaxID=31234 RepID=A0A6A5G5I0_CAERE|nr:hypothetical protein GCK72_016470 [Caenorhabditis remanei]KAF1749925.1 hypothetical protein GCK72_016470 [Caenorhabditis remanei]